MKKIIMAISLTAASLIVISLILLGCAKVEERQQTPPETSATTQTQSPNTASLAGEILSDLSCAGENIQGKIKNVLNQEISVSAIRILFNGYVVNPAMLKCDKTSLKAGETTTCSSLQGVMPVRAANEITAVLPGAQPEKQTITC